MARIDAEAPLTVIAAPRRKSGVCETNTSFPNQFERLPVAGEEEVPEGSAADCFNYFLECEKGNQRDDEDRRVGQEGSSRRA